MCTWKAMVTFRQAGPNNAPSLLTGPATGLLVWGRITGAGVVLEPAFRVPVAGALPDAGPHRLELLGADGRVLRAVAFQAAEVADLPGEPERHFAFVVPLDAASDQSLAGMRVSSAGRMAQRTAAAAPDAPAPDLSRVHPEQVELRWDPAQYPMVMVRDPASGQILSFARGGTARLWTRSGEFQLIYSNGVNSVSRSARVLR